MNAPDKPTSPIKTYRILARCEQFFEIDVKASSPENACKRIQERLKRDASAQGLVNVEDGKPSGYSWSPPNECGYVISGDELPSGLDGVFSFWDGEKIVQNKIKS
jgi:hypothetical protein